MKKTYRNIALCFLALAMLIGNWGTAGKALACVSEVFLQSANCGPYPDYNYEYQYEYPTPYDYPTPYAYPTPAYGTPYSYPTPAPVDQCQTSQDCPTYGQAVYDDTGRFCGYDRPACEPLPGGTVKVCRTSGCGFGDNVTPAPYSTPYATPYGTPYATPANQYPTPYPTPAASFNYSLSNSGSANVAKVSGNAFTQDTITKTLISGVSSAVSLSVSGLPSGASYSIANGSCSPSCSSTITFAVSQSAPVGTYRITVTGTPLNKSTSFDLNITSAALSVSCLGNPQTPNVNQAVTWSANINGGTPPYAYSWSGTAIPTNPVPTSTPPFVISYSTVGQKNMVLSITDSKGLQASCPAASVQVNFNPDFKEF